MKAYVGIGSNLENRLEHFQKAVSFLSEIAGLEILAASSIYETSPISCEGGLFYNAVLELESSLAPLEMMKFLLSVEKKMGRQREKVQQARVIDLDLLINDVQVLQDTILILPHPRMHERRFVLEPLCELNSKLIHPVLKKTMGELLIGLKDPNSVKKLFPFQLNLKNTKEAILHHTCRVL